MITEESVDFFEDIINALLGDKVAFLDGIYLDEKDCTILRAKLTESGENPENALRLMECIDCAETKQKVKYIINVSEYHRW